MSLDIFSDSLFYKKIYKDYDDLIFHNDNLFFFDINLNNNLSYFNVNLFPVKACFDYSTLKQNDKISILKPKFLNFKNFSENQFSNFEKFYLKNDIFMVDGFEHGMVNDENLDFFMSDRFEEERIEDFKHFFFTRLPLPPVYGKIKKDVEEEAKIAAVSDMNTDPDFLLTFDVPSNFYRLPKTGAKYDKPKKYKGVDKSFFSGILLDKKIFYNTSSFRKYNLKNFFLYNFIFGYSRDASS